MPYPYTYQHGQSAMIITEFEGETIMEEVIIDEMIGNGETVAVRYVGSDDVVPVDADNLGAAFGEPCGCRS